MKRKTLLIVAGTAVAAVLGFTQLGNAADPVAKPSPAPEEATPAPPPPGGPGKERWGMHRGPRGFGDESCCHKFGDRKRFGPGEFGARPWGGELNLTDDQKAKVKEIFEANRPKIEAIRKEQQEKIQAVMQEAQKEIRPLLTPAQQQVLDDMTKLRESQRKLREDSAAVKKAE